jgi:hypothetical protein
MLWIVLFMATAALLTLVFVPDLSMQEFLDRLGSSALCTITYVPS